MDSQQHDVLLQMLHERILGEIYHENKEREAEAEAEEMLDIPQEWETSCLKT